MECENRTVRDELRQYLANHAVESRNYFYPLHLQPVNYFYFEANKMKALQAVDPTDAARADETWLKDLPNALQFASTGFYIPTHSFLEEGDVAFIVDVIAAYFATGGGKEKHTGVAPREFGWVDEKRSTLFQTPAPTPTNKKQ